MSDRFETKNSKNSLDMRASMRNGILSIFLVTTVTILAVVFVSIGSSNADEHVSDQNAESTVIARATLAFCEDSEAEVGTAELVERWSEEGVKLVDVYIRVTGLADEAGLHAVHIHETGSCDPCSAAGGHFDPGPHGHSHPDGNHPFHSGDLVNIRVDDSGDGELRTTTSRITLSPGPLSIFDEDGASLIIHVDPDTYCPGGEEAGCAGGARLACGIFAIHEET